MKYLSLFGLLLSSNIFCAEEYIVKVNAQFKQKGFNEIKIIRELNLSFGQYKIISSPKLLSTKKLKSITNIKGVEFIEKNHQLHTQEFKVAPEKDWYYDQQWGLLNTGANSRGNNQRGIAGEDINAENAWTISEGSEHVVIAVIDTGIEHSHPDLKDNMWVNEIERNGLPGIDDDGNGFVDDIYGYDFVDNDGDPMDEKVMELIALESLVQAITVLELWVL